MVSRAKAVRLGGDWAATRSDLARLDAMTLETVAVMKSRRRAGLAVLSFVLVFGVLVGRLVDLTFAAPIQVQSQNAQDKSRQLRPDIIDRNGRVMATNITLASLSAKARKIEKPEQVLSDLQKIIPGLDREDRLAAMKHHDAVLLATQLSPGQKRDVLALGNPYLELEDVQARVYPSGSSAAHLTGFVSLDQRGLAGLEYHLEEMRDWSAPVQTTIDMRVQAIMQDVLRRGMAHFSVEAGVAIMMDVTTGEILGLVSAPDYDPNGPTRQGTGAHFNHATQGRYELGSVFKVLTVAMALEYGLVAPEDKIDTSEPLKVGKFEIDDVHPQRRPLTPAEILIYSSNIGSGKLALKASPDQVTSFWSRLGFYDRMDLPFPERISSSMPERLGEVERVATSYGHGIATPPIQFIAAAAAIINGGTYYPPRLFPVDFPEGMRVISPEVSAQMRDMMRQVVLEGTGRKAEAEGYYVIGKTGSADKASAGGYAQDKIVASFFGAFPYQNPKYAVLVMLDDPKGRADTAGLNFAGWNAAPLVGDIIKRTAPLLGLMPAPEAQDFVHADAGPLIGGDDASR